MLQEILLSLSGHPSPLLQVDNHDAVAFTSISPAERDLLSTAARLSDLHVKLASESGRLAREHGSVICQAVATTIENVHLAAWRRKVLEVEEKILRKDAEFVGGYDIVPITAVINEFSGWRRKLEWLWGIVEFIIRGDERSKEDNGENNGRAMCSGANLMDKLRGELRSGYRVVEETALTLVKSAEMAWLKQVSAWVLYGRLPNFGCDDFFVRHSQEDGKAQQYTCVQSLLPGFVLPSTASSMLFIGKCLNHARVKSTLESGLEGRNHLTSQLRELSSLTYPLHAASFSRAITSIRLSLSRNTLQKLLPLSRVVEILGLFRDFFLLARGEFAMTLTQEADEKNRNRWRRAENLAYEKKDGLGNVAVKQGEVARTLARTWASMGSMQGLHADEDEGLELARDLLSLQISKSKPATPLSLTNGSGKGTSTVASTPFRNLLFSIPVVLTLSEIPSPLDMFLAPADLQIYSSINSYLLSIRRAHIRLTDLWKITTLRRHHPAPPAPPGGSTRLGRAKVLLLRERYTSRSSTMRSAWVTSSAAVFFLAETEAYMQAEVVAGLWDGFHSWLTCMESQASHKAPVTAQQNAAQAASPAAEDEDDIWLSTPNTSGNYARRGNREPNPTQQHDPESLATAHRTYLRGLTLHLLLTQPSFTEPLYALLVHIDHLVALVHRLDAIWTSMDLESDEGVVDAFADLEADERSVRGALRDLEEKVKRGIEEVVHALRVLEMDAGFAAELENGRGADEEGVGAVDDEEGRYVPHRVGGINRLLMKLDFGVWFGAGDGLQIEMGGPEA